MASQTNVVTKDIGTAQLVCVCNRPLAIVICHACGHYRKSCRMQMRCPVHTRTTYLLDLTACPNVNCRSGQLKEYPIPPKSGMKAEGILNPA